MPLACLLCVELAVGCLTTSDLTPSFSTCEAIDAPKSAFVEVPAILTSAATRVAGRVSCLVRDLTPSRGNELRWFRSRPSRFKRVLQRYRKDGI